jgi:hypothetical protein
MASNLVEDYFKTNSQSIPAQVKNAIKSGGFAYYAHPDAEPVSNVAVFCLDDF